MYTRPSNTSNQSWGSNTGWGHTVAHVEENAASADVALSPGDVAALSAAFPEGAAEGSRYPEGQLKALGI